uniref:DUF402 domain-containing protein n=1 Tax=Fervidicoccus fontis TaxID=683846 RepID=A0A7J3ZLQ9_9CREN
MEKVPVGGSGVAVRVRGVYATAITKALLDWGFIISQPSRVIAERFGVEENSLPAKVTVKDVEESRNRLLVVGEARFFEGVFDRLKSILSMSFYSTSTLQLHSTITVRVSGSRSGVCMGSFQGQIVHVETQSCTSDKIVKAAVVHAPPFNFQVPVVREGFSILKDTLVLNSWKHVSISRHIRGGNRIELLSELAGIALREGFGVRWRSNAGIVPEELLRRELEEALEEAKKLKNIVPDREGLVLSGGEIIGTITLSRADKLLLDEMRGAVVPTIPNHHALKVIGNFGGSIVEFAEHLVRRGISRDTVGRLTLEYVYLKIAESGRVMIRQFYPEGNFVDVGPFRIKRHDSELTVMELERTIRSRGYYDGLGVEKSPGDVAFTLVFPERWVTVHMYASASGEPKGVYVNVNSPPEPLGENAIGFLDLHIDVVKRPGGPPEIVDRERLESAFARGLLGERLYSKSLEVALSLQKELATLTSPRDHLDAKRITELITSNPTLM